MTWIPSMMWIPLMLWIPSLLWIPLMMWIPSMCTNLTCHAHTFRSKYLFPELIVCLDILCDLLYLRFSNSLPYPRPQAAPSVPHMHLPVPIQVLNSPPKGVSLEEHCLSDDGVLEYHNPSLRGACTGGGELARRWTRWVWRVRLRRWTWRGRERGGCRGRGEHSEGVSTVGVARA